jgi:hypothetical protein
MATPKGIAPYFLVADVIKAAEYYRDKLGFTIRGYFFEDPPVFGMVGRGDGQIIMLSLMEGGRGGSNRDQRISASTPISGSRMSTRCTPSSSATRPTSSCRRSCVPTA